ncbi:MAG: hypothetical protein PUA90_01030 [bacterium]|nr:hypothetical protein [bacterium]
MKKKITIIILIILVLIGTIISFLILNSKKDKENKEVDNNVVTKLTIDEIINGKNKTSWQSYNAEFIKADGQINEMEIVGIKLNFIEEYINICIISDESSSSCEDLKYSYENNTLTIEDGMLVHFQGNYTVSYEDEILKLSGEFNDNRRFSYFFKMI